MTVRSVVTAPGVLLALPATIEGRLPGFAVETWYGVRVPAGVSSDIVKALDTAVSRPRRPNRISGWW